MRLLRQAILSTGFVVGASLSFVGSSAHAQGTGLGGYGAREGGGPSAGAGGSSVAAFGGRFGAEIPSGGTSGGLSFRSRQPALMNSTRTTFSIGPMGGGTSSGLGRRRFVLEGLDASGGLGPGGGIRRRTSAASPPRVMPPNFGSPFRQPPSLVAPSSPF
ncbi:MAG: hypothetical protein ABI353_03460 [Isosphaeraceae bacterium]